MKTILFALAATLLAGCAEKKYYTQQLPWKDNYDESLMPPYELPDLMTCRDGTKVTNSEIWEKKRRPELLALFQSSMYGKLPPAPQKISSKIIRESTDALDGTAILREVMITLQNCDKKHSFILLLYIPKNIKSAAPAFVGLNFYGNHTTSHDPYITVTGLPKDPSPDYLNELKKKRGFRSYRFPVKEIISRGYAVATASYHDIFPDRRDGWNESIYRLFFSAQELQKRPKGYSAISAWAWGISRITDYLCTLQEIDSGKLTVFGHSRLGKTALWAGVNDTRFKLVCVNNAGCGGTALSRRLYGETLFSMCFRGRQVGRWWFTDTLPDVAISPEKLPVDQHQLLALVAPRTLSIHSATLDQWADPKGEYLSAFHAGKIFALYGKNPLLSPNMPPADTPVGDDISYMIRTGKHDLCREDWMHYLDMADRIFK